jgi:hypothetical protein
MILHPPVLALLLGSLLTSFMLLYASWYGGAILRRWDLQSGSELQLGLERKTYLISTLVSYAFGFQLLSLFLFVYTADDLCPLFVGAMCAAGTLNVNSFGYPTLALKLLNFLLAGTWLVLNHVDNKAYDYPLIRKKYLFLLLITPVMLAETVMQFRYFHGLLPDIITSCCGTLFSAAPRDEGSAMSFLSGLPLRPVFFIGMGATIATGLVVYVKAGKGSLLFGLMSAGVLVVSLMALISVFSLYVYELPAHHCPFCLLEREYRYIGYPLYLSLFGGTVAGLGAGVIAPFKRIESLARSIPPFQQRLVMTSIVCYGIFMLIIIWETIFSNLKLA